MEDAATAEISRAQIWQWLHNGARLDDGRPITRELFEKLLAARSWGQSASRTWARIRASTSGHFEEAAAIFAQIVTCCEA